MGVDSQGLVLPGGWVEVDEPIGRDGEGAVFAGYEYPFVGAAAADAAFSAVYIVLNLRVIAFERLRERWVGRSDEHKVSPTRDGEFVADGVAGFHAVERESTLDGEAAHGVAESIGRGGERFDVDIYRIAVDGLLCILCRIEGVLAHRDLHGQLQGFGAQ